METIGCIAEMMETGFRVFQAPVTNKLLDLLHHDLPVPPTLRKKHGAKLFLHCGMQEATLIVVIYLLAVLVPAAHQSLVDDEEKRVRWEHVTLMALQVPL